MLRERLSIKAGVAVVRYVGSAGREPTARIALSVTEPGVSELVLDPRCRDGELTRPGHVAVVRAERDTVIEMTIRATTGGSPRGSVRVEYLSRMTGGPERAGGRGVSEGPAALRPEALSSLEWRAHVAYRGDLRGTSSEWICGPGSENRIEAVSLYWPDCPAGLDLRMALPGGPVVPLGGTAGSRGRSSPITGLDLELAGAIPPGLSLEAEAMFARRRRVRERGRAVRLRGQDRSDELVGLRLRLVSEAGVEADRGDSDRDAPRRSDEPVADRRGGGERVRIFRQ